MSITVFDCLVIRASVPMLNLDDVFEQKNDIAKAVEDELEKVRIQSVGGVILLFEIHIST